MILYVNFCTCVLRMSIIFTTFAADFKTGTKE